MNVLVLGGNGFIGSHIVDRLLAEGHRVRVYDRFSERYRAPLSAVDYHAGSFDDIFGVAEALAGIDVVYHLVSTTVPSTSNLNPAADVSDNLISTIHMLDKMVKSGIKRIIFLSSGGTVYGNPGVLPIPETHPLHPICSYGIVKLAIENYLLMYQHLHGLSTLVLRPSNPYGPRQSHSGVQGLISTFLRQIMSGQPLKVWGDGTVVRDYLYVEDLARLCVVAGLSQENGIFNVGSGEGHSVREIIKIVREVTGEDPEVIHEPPRPYDVAKVILDISLAKKTFEWTPQTPIEQGIHQQWRWLKKIRHAEVGNRHGE